MAGGSIVDGFSKMRTIMDNPPSVASWCNPPRKPWCGHPGTPNACKTMKYCLSLLLPDDSESEIDDLNTYLLTVARSKEDYENLLTLEKRVLMYPFRFSGPIVVHPCNCSFNEENLSLNCEPASGRPDMAGGSIVDGFSKMRTVMDNPPSVASWCNPPRKPWCGHPGTPNACKTMKYCLSLLLPDHSDSQIDDLNTYLLTMARSQEDYENLLTLEKRVLMYPFMFSGPIVVRLCNCSFNEENLSPNYEPASGLPAGGLSRPCIGPQKQQVEKDSDQTR